MAVAKGTERTGRTGHTERTERTERTGRTERTEHTEHAEHLESSLLLPASIRPANIKPASIKHNFFGRRAERVSASSSDDLDACAQLGLLSGELGSHFSHFMCVRQFHSNEVISLTDRTKLWSKHANAPRGDGIVTNLHGVLLGVYTADCAPILLADSSGNSCGKSCGIAHAGWRGALAGVIESAVAGMTALGTRVEDIKVAIGPTISALSYPVSDDFLAAILEHEIPLTRDNKVFFHRYSASRHSDSWHFDLGEYACARLRGCGISDDRIDFLNVDTFSDEGYFSHRRFVGTGAGAGRNFSCIGFV